MFLPLWQSHGTGAIRWPSRPHPPDLALYASEDEYMSTRDELPAAKAALAANPDAKVVEIAGVNHAFRHVKNVSSLEKDHVGSFSAPELIEIVTDRLSAGLHPAKAKTASLN